MKIRNKEVAALVKEAQASGWIVSQRKSGHLMFKSPDGKHIVVCSSTPSDHRSIKNTRGDLKKRGMEPLEK